MVIYEKSLRRLIIPDGLEGYTQADIDAAFQSGYTEGNADGYTDGYADGLDDGAEEQKSLLEPITITENGTYEREDGYSSILVNVASGETINNQVKSSNLTVNGTYIVTYDSGYTGLQRVDITVAVPQTGYTQEDLDAAYQSGYTAGLNDCPECPDTGYSSQYLTIEALENGTLYWVTNSSAFTKTIEYSKNDGTWTPVTSSSGNSGTTVTTVVAGDKVFLRGNNSWYCDTLRQTYFATDFEFNVYGNIMSLIYGNDFKNQTTITDEHSLCSIFTKCDKLINTENLILPATTLTRSCYSNMFDGCTSLRTTPVLPATTLAEDCYRSMFRNCTSLTTAPELLATTLTSRCYIYMFEGCTNLNYIKCLATTNVTVNNCGSWVNNVSSTGTFVKAAGVNWPSGNDGIPVGWTIQDAS